MKRLIVCLVALALVASGCASNGQKETKSSSENKKTAAETQKIEGVQIELSDEKITVDGQKITNDSSKAVYSAKDIVFYPAGKDFTYGEGESKDEHEQSEADAHTVLHIAKAGRYVLSGELSKGQIAVDLGEDAKKDPNAVVTLVLNNLDVTCSVAPAVIFYNVYECCESDEENATMQVDTKSAGANVIIADGTENNINGSYVAKIYESYELSEDGKEVVDSEKLHKYDGAFYSKRSMNINGGEKGTGVLNIKAENEGLDSELHLTINGGMINITSGNDGINTNEDNVSVTTMNGGELNIVCDGSTGEGDGIDSNGWLVINGGVITAQACATSGDAGIDSDKGIYINGGKVVASGNMLDQIAGGDQTYAVFNFASRQSGDSTYTLKNSDGKTVGEYAPKNAFTYLIIAGDELLPDDYTFFKGEAQLSASKAEGFGTGAPGGERPEMPEGEVPQGERPEKPEGEMPEGMERPEKPDGEIPEMPEGAEPPQKGDGMRGENMMPNEAERSTVFIFQKGGNQFSNVSPT